MEYSHFFYIFITQKDHLKWTNSNKQSGKMSGLFIENIHTHFPLNLHSNSQLGM